MVEGFEEIPCTIYDVSGSGLSLESPRAFEIGTAVVIEGLAFAGEGVVRHCVPRSQGFRLGILLNANNTR